MIKAVTVAAKEPSLQIVNWVTMKAEHEE